VAFAATAGHEAARALADDLAEEFLHWAAKQRDGLPPGGTTLVAAATALAVVGQPEEGCWPYDQDRAETTPGYGPSAEAHANAGTRVLVLGEAIAPDYPSIRARLDAAAGPMVLLGLDVHDDWYSVGSNGVIPMTPAGAALDGHAVLVVGYREVDGADELIIRNSWGASWGDAGYGYVGRAYLEQHGISAWSLVVP
jgi:hypothetical protein